MKKETKPDSSVKKEIKHILTPEELSDYGSKLAKATSERDQLESDKKSSAADFKSKIEAKSSEAKSLSIKISNGYEPRIVDCGVFFNDPNTGIKRVVRKDTGEEVERVTMTQEELQLDLPFPAADKEDDE